MKRILLTGSTGFIGCRLLKLLESSKCEIRLLSRQPHSDYETIVCELGKKQVPESALVSIDTVFHLAGYAHDLRDATSVENRYQAINVEATVQLAKLAAQHGVKYFIFVSSVKAGGSAIACRCMTEENQDEFNVLRKVDNKPDSTQRELAKELGFSLGKLNYCLKALKTKGLIKINNFKKNPHKMNYMYLLTPKGVAAKSKLTLNFMKKKMEEYEELKKEIKQ